MFSLSFQEVPLRSSPSPANSTAGTIDSDGWDASFADISTTVPLPVSDRCFGHLQPTLLQRAKPSNFLLDRKKTDKLKKKKKRKRRDSDVPGKEGYVGGLLQLEAADPYAETPTSPTLQDIPQAAGDPCSGWDSDTPSSGSCTTVSPDQVKEIKTEGKRTIVRQGKQVVFRDEDSTGNDEDIMVDSGEWPRGGMLRVGFQDPNLPLPLQGLWVQSLVEELRSHVPAMRCGVSMWWFLPWKGTGEHTPPPSGERV